MIDTDRSEVLRALEALKRGLPGVPARPDDRQLGHAGSW